MGSRLKLQELLEKLIDSENVYFQPPSSVRIGYPAIVYTLGGIDNEHANDAVYNQRTNYELTYITDDPDDENVKKISLLPLCKLNRPFKSDNLNHYVFTLYY